MSRYGERNSRNDCISGERTRRIVQFSGSPESFAMCSSMERPISMGRGTVSTQTSVSGTARQSGRDSHKAIGRVSGPLPRSAMVTGVSASQTGTGKSKPGKRPVSRTRFHGKK